ncbi:MAG TPA: hypothetical protein EYO58_11855, partial [Flavobacteriales bacterium]|nr:hypothetical protein [Flavobacteriales bacterium]
MHWSDVTEKYTVPITTDFISKYKHNKAHGFIWKGDHPPPSEWLKIADHGYRSDNAREIKQLEAEQHSTPGEKDPFAGVVMSAGGFGGEGGGNADAPNQHGVVIDKRGEATSYGYDPAQDWPHMDSLKHFVKSFKEKFDHNLEL